MPAFEKGADPRQGAELKHLADANIFSRMVMWWTTSLMRLGSKKELEMVDLWKLEEQHTAAHLGGALSRTWNDDSVAARARGKQPSLLRSWWRLHRLEVIGTGLLQLLLQVLQIAPFHVLNQLLASITNRDGIADGLMWTALLVVLLFARTLAENHYMRLVFHLSLMIRAGVMHFVYSKALLLTPTARQANSLGQMVNLMQLDTEKLVMATAFLHQLWAGIVAIAFAVASLVWVIGPSALAGVVIIVVLVPISMYIANLMRVYQRESAKFTDERIKVINEVLQGIRIIKFYSWESSFLLRIRGLREAELTKLRTKAVLKAVSSVLLQAAPAFTTIATFGVYVSVGGEISTSNVPVIFTALALFAQLRNPLMMYPMVLSFLTDARVSVTRLERFFNLKELRAGEGVTRRPDATSAVVSIEDGTFSWDPELTTDGTSGRLADVAVGGAKFRGGSKSKGAREGSGSISGKGWRSDKPGATLDSLQTGDRAHARGQAHTRTSQGVITVDSAARANVKEASPGGAEAGPTLTNVTFSAEVGKLTMVIGPVGAGKSSLLSALLGEMRVDSGGVCLDGSVAFVSQQAWILNATVRENILFFGDYDEDRYREAVRLAVLEHDLDSLPAGDETEIGERGINLSGGQKQRVAIARAVYTRARIVIMDDPLSALDAHVSRRIFDHCIVGSLRASGRTVVLVTNQVQFAGDADHIFVVGDGRIAEQGTYTELMGRNGSFATLMESMQVTGHKDERKGKDEGDVNSEEAAGGTMSQAQGQAQITAAIRGRTAGGLGAAPTSEPKPASFAGDAGARATAAGSSAGGGTIGTITSKERKATGEIKRQVYTDYFRAAKSTHLAVIVLMLYMINQANMVASDWWLSAWAQGTLFPGQSTVFYLGVFVALGVTLAVFTFLRTLGFTYTGLRASNRLHTRLALVVMQGTMAFFDTTPLGRIIARFASDMNKIDETLPHAVELALFCIFSVIATFVVIASVTPLFLAAAAPILFLYYRTQVYFKLTALDLKRLDQSARGPLYSFFSETLSGLNTIRAFAKQDNFNAKMEARLDNSTRALWAQKMIERWLGLRLEALGNAVIGAAAMMGVFAAEAGQIYPGLVGLSLAYAFRATGLMTFAVRQVTEAQTQMTASEQILLYVNTVETEKSVTDQTVAALDRSRRKRMCCTPHKAVHKDKARRALEANTELAEIALDNKKWLQLGTVDFDAVSMRYREGLDLVLRRVSFSVPAGAKVGVVGRTGSGKSSCMLLLLRMVEPAEGTVRIDGTDIRQLTLEQLRGALSMIPQDPVLFSGSIRSNLDPFGAHADDRLWDVLGKVRLGDSVRNMEDGLDADVAEYGENFSVGQRQLICLARALLRAGKILLMDEATSSVDYETDQLIQTLIRREFAAATVITIAHRLNTIIDSDKILVLRDGKRAEYDTPHMLLQHPPSDEGSGLLSSLVERTGKESALHLRAVARAAFEKSNCS